MGFVEARGEIQASTRIRRNTVWDTIQFTANGIIFVLLGEQLPMILAGATETVRLTGHHGPWWLALYVFAVPSQEPRHADIRVEQLQAVPLAQQAFDQLDQGALAKIVRARLEAEPENADLLRAFLDDAARRTFDLVVVAEHYALEERNGHVEHSRLVSQRTQVFRQA